MNVNNKLRPNGRLFIIIVLLSTKKVKRFNNNYLGSGNFSTKRYPWRFDMINLYSIEITLDLMQKKGYTIIINCNPRYFLKV